MTRNNLYLEMIRTISCVIVSRYKVSYCYGELISATVRLCNKLFLLKNIWNIGLYDEKISMIPSLRTIFC